ncbi:MAG TPA: MFS transporter [Chthoniobacterales bacterium]
MLLKMVTIWSDPKARLILTGNFLLVVGAGITFMAVPWLLIQQPNGNAILGYSNVAVTLLILFLLPYFGKIVDRYSRKRVVLVYLGSAVVLDALIVAVILGEGSTKIWELLTVFCFGSLGASVYYPAQFALSQEVIAPERYESLSGAIEIQWQAGSMFAGALGAWLIAVIPFWGVLCIDAAAYLSAFLIMSRLQYQRAQERSMAPASAWAMLIEGLQYLRGRPRLSVVMLASYLPFLAIMVGNFLSPIFVREVLRGGPQVYGIGEVSYAVGATLAGLSVPAINARIGLVPTLFCTIAVYGVAASLNPMAPIAIVFFVSYVLQGWGNAGSRVARTILVLKTVPNGVVGRVNLFYSAFERMLRSTALALVTAMLPAWGAANSYWVLAVIAAAAWLMVWSARHVRAYPVETVSVGES